MNVALLVFSMHDSLLTIRVLIFLPVSFFVCFFSDVDCNLVK